MLRPDSAVRPVSAECRVCELGYGAVYNLDGGLASLHSLLQLAGFSTPGQLPDVSARGAESKSKLLGKRWLLISKSCRAELSLGSFLVLRMRDVKMPRFRFARAAEILLRHERRRPGASLPEVQNRFYALQL